MRGGGGFVDQGAPMSIALMTLVWELDLPPGEKLVLLALADQANDNGAQCWPSVDTIARRSGQGERTVRRALASLETKGHLTRDHRDGTSTKYRVHPCQIGTPAKKTPLPKTTKTPAKLAPKPSRTINDLPNGKSKRVRNLVVSKPEGVSDKVWSSFLGLRKAKRAPVTDVVIEEIEGEARKLGWGLEAALRQMVARGWQGFEAKWVKDDGNGNRTSNSTAGAAALARANYGIGCDH